MFIKNPDPFLLPSYRISPFQTSSLNLSYNIPLSNKINSYFNDRFGENNWLITLNGREAIELALAEFGFCKSDLLSILTTSNNLYISSCVTTSISKYCEWNREINDQTKLVFVNHEFGYPFQGMSELSNLKIPIIEDCCTTFFSQNEEGQIGNYGKYSIFSFPKFFPIQIGGLLVGENVASLKSAATQKQKEFIVNFMSYFLPQFSEIIGRREFVYHSIESKFSQFGFLPRFTKTDKIIPSVFLFNTNNKSISLTKMKEYFWNHGIQCSVFYGENAFFVPAHQNLTEVDLDYFEFVINSFLECT